MAVPAESPNGVSFAVVERLLVILDADHGRHRSKNLLARDTHLIGRLGEEGWLQIEAQVLAVEPLAAPMQPRALALAYIEITQVLIELISSTTGPISVPGFSASSTTSFFSRSVSPSTKRSWMPAVTIRREDAVQRRPVEK